MNLILNKYRLDSDSENFRMFYKNTPTNLVWYCGTIFYIPDKYLKLNSLIRCKNDSIEYELNSAEQNILDELYESNLDIKLEQNIEDLYLRLKNSGLALDFGIFVTFLDNNDYSRLDKPIYLGDKKWLNNLNNRVD